MSADTTALRAKMTEDLQLRGLSERTQEAYLRAVRKLAGHFRTPPDRLCEEQVREYLLYLKNDRGFAPGSMRIAVNGIKFFYRYTQPRDWATLLYVRIPAQKTLPDVLSRQEVRDLLASVRTRHNRAYLWTVYSCGLRLNEGLHLQTGDVDGKRMMMHVHRGKGAKDRFVILPKGTPLPAANLLGFASQSVLAIPRPGTRPQARTHGRTADGRGQRAGRLETSRRATKARQGRLDPHATP